jgi:hypothetical protein
MSSSTPTIKEVAHELVDSLPDEATWEDLMHRIHVRQAIDRGLRDAEAGRTHSTDEVRRRFGLEP